MIRLVIITTLIFLNNANSNILYDKHGLAITEIDLKQYIELYNNNYQTNLSQNIAKKKLILLKKKMNFLKQTNPDLIKVLDMKISTQFNDFENFSPLEKDFIRFLNIRNDFILDYYNKNFSLSDLEEIFDTISEIKLPLSKNSCLTIDQFLNLKNNGYFIRSLFSYIKDRSNILEASIENEIYSVCMNEKFYKNLENIIIQFIENKTEEKFDRFLYGYMN